MTATGGCDRHTRAGLAGGVAAGPLFVAGFTVMGWRRADYDWRRHAVSSLAVGRGGWRQRANFIVAGLRYCIAARGLKRSQSPLAEPPVVPMLVFGAGAGLIGSGLFVTDPANGFPPDATGAPESTRAGQLHNLCAIPIFAGIPLAALASAAAAVRSGQHRWAAYSAGSALVTASAIVLFGAGLGGDVPRLTPVAGVFQRISIASGFGWLTALSWRAMA